VKSEKIWNHRKAKRPRNIARPISHTRIGLSEEPGEYHEPSEGKTRGKGVLHEQQGRKTYGGNERSPPAKRKASLGWPIKPKEGIAVNVPTDFKKKTSNRSRIKTCRKKVVMLVDPRPSRYSQAGGGTATWGEEPLTRSVKKYDKGFKDERG